MFITREVLWARMAPLRATVEMETPRKFRATGYTGAVVPIHFPAEGERREGPGPMEMTLLGVGACTAIDVVSILEKGRELVEGFRVELEAEIAPEPPSVFTRIHLRYVLRGDLKEANVRRAIDLSMEKYCSVSIMLKRGGVDVTTSYEIERPTR